MVDYIKDLIKKLDSGLAPLPDHPILIDMLKHLLSEEDAKIMCAVGNLPSSLHSIARRLGMKSKELKPKMDKLLKKGLVQYNFGSPQPKKGWSLPNSYAFIECLPPLVESQWTKEYQEKLKTYSEDVFDDAMSKHNLPALRKIPINKEVEDTSRNAMYSEIVDIINNAEKIVAIPCACVIRKTGKHKWICFRLNWFGEYFKNAEMGREITKKQALKICENEQKISGTPRVSFWKKDIIAICNCDDRYCDISLLQKEIENRIKKIPDSVTEYIWEMVKDKKDNKIHKKIKIFLEV